MEQIQDQAITSLDLVVVSCLDALFDVIISRLNASWLHNLADLFALRCVLHLVKSSHLLQEV